MQFDARYSVLGTTIYFCLASPLPKLHLGFSFALLAIAVSKPKQSSSIYRMLLAMERSISGRKFSPVIAQYLDRFACSAGHLVGAKNLCEKVQTRTVLRKFEQYPHILWKFESL